MRNEKQKKLAGCLVPALSAADALFVALKDEDTASFLRTHFAEPELKPEVLSRRWVTEHDSTRLWQVAIIEKSRLGGRPGRFFNIAHISLDAASGEIRQKRFFANVFLEEYHEFIDRLSARRSG
jgi:hypothetical protein